MRLFVGLGNPGPRHERQRHNVGFMAVDRIAADHGFSAWRSRFRGELAEGRLGRHKVMLLKPMTFMNLSGESVGEVLRFFRIEPAEMVVFHDELDLAPGRLRVKQGGGHAGHNGLRSLHQHVGEAFWRVRIGIGHPGHRDRVTGHVLGDFGEGERAWLDELLRGISEGAPALAEDDVTGFLAAV
ncbi:MAG: aminoacyl-tRNA hydrolase, partial [Alphaproteobacteria bacterium]